MHTREFEFNDEDFRRIKHLIYEVAGILLNDSKVDLVYSRLAKRLRKRGLCRFDDYLKLLDHENAERVEFINALTTNLTSFFREPHHFESLAAFFASRKGTVKIWCGAASTGEEPYSIAMTAVETYRSWQPPVTIFATDLATNVLSIAERGVYPTERIKAVDAWRLRHFFLKGEKQHEGKVKVRNALR